MYIGSSILFNFYLLRAVGKLGPIPAYFRLETQGYTLGRTPTFLRTNTETNDHLNFRFSHLEWPCIDCLHPITVILSNIIYPDISLLLVLRFGSFLISFEFAMIRVRFTTL